MIDIDIDIPIGTNITKLFPSSIPASRVNGGELVKHPCGHYFENIAVDKLTGLAAIPHKAAAEQGFTKIDFLHLHLLSQFKSKAEFRKVCNTPPDWAMLKDRSVVEQLFQINKHYDIVSQIGPRSVQELADVIALIRPEKRQLLREYMWNKQKTRPLLYRSASDDKSAFRAGHSLSYAVTIVAQLNLIRDKLAELD